MKNGGKLHMEILAFCHNGGKNCILCGPKNPKPTQGEGYQTTQNFVRWGSFKKWKWNLTPQKKKKQTSEGRTKTFTIVTKS